MKPMLCNSLEGGMGRRWKRGLRGSMYVYLWLIHVVIQLKTNTTLLNNYPPIKYQLKIFNGPHEKKNKIENSVSDFKTYYIAAVIKTA